MAEETGQDIEAWRQVFQMLIQEVKPWHKWTLTPDKGLLPNVLQPGWMQYQLWTFARFWCSSCSRSWASAHVQVLFHMHWSEGKSRGQVKMRVFAQRCKKCSQPPFEVPEFTQENITRVLNNLVIQILKKCYREGFKLVKEIPAIKKICLQGPHDSKNCEACLLGFCAQSGLDLAKQSSVPTPSKDTGERRLTATWTSQPCSKPTSKVDKLLISTVSSEVPNPPRTDPKVKHSSKPSTAPRFLTQQVPPMSTMSPRVPNPPKADPKVRHSSESSTAPRFLTQQVPPTSTMSPRVPNPPKADPKVRHSSESSTAPRFLTQQVPPMSTVSPRVPNPPKADPKVRHSSEPSTAPRFLTQQVPPMSTVSPRVPNPPKADPKVRHSSEPSTAPRFLTQQVPPMSTVSPRVPNPPKADPKVRHSSEPSTAPSIPIQWVPTISSLAPGLATQMPSPTKSSTAADAANRVTRPKTGKTLPSSLLLDGATRTASLPTSRSPATDAICQVERRVQIYPSSERFYFCPFQNRTPECLSTCCCCLLLIIVVIVTVIMVKLPI
ncbi:receptor-transporting protein 3 [Sciurus carolinensis]|uniref:receptor-transporting protein 3 n=1 Tax=Sciurus carolinensis TaxID=30640 RepID=UPI001FB29D74|nr:receptor-transporting protein 3 [Sciurus carolinensis]XP_047387881.1 receptor-transporting protein 3 [Sciurus carolinensis]